MKERFDVSLLESGNLIKNGVKSILSHTGRVIATITFSICSLALFTNISFAKFSLESFSCTAAIMLIASYLLYFSMEDAGEKLGEESEEWKRTVCEYQELVRQIKGDKITHLRDFCNNYAKDELAFRQNNLLMYYGYSQSDYQAYKNGAVFIDKKAVRAFKKAERLKSVRLSPRVLLSHKRNADRSEIYNPENSKLFHMILSLIPTSICMILTVSIMLSAKSNLDAATVIDALLKLSSLAIIGIRGYGAGYSYVKDSLSVWVETKSRMLDSFLKEEGLCANAAQ